MRDGAVVRPGGQSEIGRAGPCVELRGQSETEAERPGSEARLRLRLRLPGHLQTAKGILPCQPSHAYSTQGLQPSSVVTSCTGLAKPGTLLLPARPAATSKKRLDAATRVLCCWIQVHGSEVLSLPKTNDILDYSTNLVPKHDPRFGSPKTFLRLHKREEAWIRGWRCDHKETERRAACERENEKRLLQLPLSSGNSKPSTQPDRT